MAREQTLYHEWGESVRSCGCRARSSAVVLFVGDWMETTILHEAGCKEDWSAAGHQRFDPVWKYATEPEAKRPSRPPISQELRLSVYERDGYQCLHCGTAENLSLDHIHPYSLGGEDTFDNLQTLCRSCNSKKGARVQCPT